MAGSYGFGCRLRHLSIEHMFDSVDNPVLERMRCVVPTGNEEGGVTLAQLAGTGTVPGVNLAESEGTLSVGPGQVAGLVGPPGFGLTRIGVSMLLPHAEVGMVALLDVRGWLSPLALWELGFAPDRMIFVRCDDPVRWGRVASTLIDGVTALYAEVPRGVKDAQLRTLGALARTRRTPLLLRPVRRDLPGGIAHLRVEASGVVWEGADEGHGRLTRRRVSVTASGKAMRGRNTPIEVEDDGTNALHLVSRLASPQARSAAG